MKRSHSKYVVAWTILLAVPLFMLLGCASNSASSLSTKGAAVHSDQSDTNHDYGTRRTRTLERWYEGANIPPTPDASLHGATIKPIAYSLDREPVYERERWEEWDFGRASDRQNQTNSTGPSVTARGLKDIDGIDTAAPPTDSLFGGNVGGGKGGLAGASFFGTKVPFNLFYIFGGILILASFATPMLPEPKPKGLGTSLALAGVSLIAAGIVINEYAWLVLVAILGLGAYFVIRYARDAKLTNTTLATVVSGVEKAGESAARPVKDAISKVAKSTGLASSIDAKIDSKKTP